MRALRPEGRRALLRAAACAARHERARAACALDPRRGLVARVAVGGDRLLVLEGAAARLAGLPSGAVTPTLDGWRDLAAPGDAVLRPCDARDRGLALVWSDTMTGFTAGSFRPNLAARIDGSPRRVREILYDLRVTVPPPARRRGSEAAWRGWLSPSIGRPSRRTRELQR